MKKISFLLAALLLFALLSWMYRTQAVAAKTGSPVLVGNPIFVLNQ